MRWSAAPVVLTALLVGCGVRQVSGGDDDDLPSATPEWGPCVTDDVDWQNCAEVCAAEGLVCVANSCPADPEYCNPKPCDMATQVFALGGTELCADPSVGSPVATTCEAPIDWLFNNTVRCCCAEPD
ncbi:hypothetical protein DB30_06006 [Enhygromyxa salina]|uniref:Lipoprotein n=1 Tax=Enhygromyxa salina TaxID=215803 RepID=A0A0C1ZVL1_9BACT|nr:hypothetical protein [Enhygromyxa salina]KIG15098.1 hypothetical protein DB30_06006 [Enhygromyxa salina]